MHRMFAIALLGAASFNCSAADEGALRSDDSLNAIDDEAVADDVVAVFDADPGDATHQYFELRYVDDGGTVELRGYGEDGQLSRATMRPMFDPDGRPWMRLSIEDEQVAFEGHIRMLSTEAGREYFELDAEVLGQVVSIRADPNDPASAELYGFPGLVEGEFSPLADYGDPTGLLTRMGTALTRYQTISSQLQTHLAAYGGDLAFRFDECFECLLFLPSPGFQGVACLGALAVATVTCNTWPNACPGAQMTAGAVCGQAISDISEHISQCKSSCKKGGAVDPCSGGCSCPGGPA